MRCSLVAAFLTMGASFTVLQTVMVRELLVSFSGNELSIGLVLGAWLVLEALGAGVAGRLSRRIPPQPAAYAALQSAWALLLLPSLLAALRVRSLAGAVPGEAIGPPAALLASLLVLCPLGLVAGASFAIAVAAYAGYAGAPQSPGRIYALEAAGSIAGGVTFTYLLLPLLSSTQILLLVASLNLASAASLFLASPRRRVPGGTMTGLLAVGALAILASPLGPALHRWAVAGRWAPAHLAFEGNSPYGNVAAIAEAGQVTVFSNGSPVLTAPDPDVAAVEEMVHLPALFLNEPPRRALVIGGGAGGVAHELLRYPLERLDYAELDPMLIQAIRAVPTSLTTEELSDPRLHLALTDGRRFVMECRSEADAHQYDLILVNLPYPSTLVLNRLYTREFYQQVRALLKPAGLLVAPSPPARTYAGPALRDLLAVYRRTLASVFPHLRAIPGDSATLWLASENRLDLDVEELVRRWGERGIEARMFRTEYLRYLLDPAVAADFDRLGQVPAAAVNRDGRPAGLRYGLAYESALLSPALEPFFRGLGRLRWGYLAVGTGVLALAGLFLLRRREAVVPVAVATTGLAGMAADLLVLFSFQVLYGSVYRQVGLLVTAFMAGLSAGGWAMTAWAGRLRRPWRALATLEAANALGAAGLALLRRRRTPAE